jgi:hypothetical protein
VLTEALAPFVPLVPTFFFGGIFGSVAEERKVFRPVGRARWRRRGRYFDRWAGLGGEIPTRLKVFRPTASSPPMQKGIWVFHPTAPLSPTKVFRPPPERPPAQTQYAAEEEGGQARDEDVGATRGEDVGAIESKEGRAGRTAPHDAHPYEEDDGRTFRQAEALPRGDGPGRDILDEAITGSGVARRRRAGAVQRCGRRRR